MGIDATYSLLLTIHIAAGFATLLGAAVAILTKIFDHPHRWHVFGGRTFFYGMTTVFLTALPMTFLKPNLFLFLIAVFSFYLAFSGWRRAINRRGKPHITDLGAMIIMGITCAGMIGRGGWLVWVDEGNGITLIVFGIIGWVLTLRNYMSYKSGPVTGKKRISAHLTMMMAAAIAAVTAFLVINIQTNPVWIAWIAPTLVITPIIFRMNKRIYSSKSFAFKRNTKN